MTDDQRDDGVGAGAATVQGMDGIENIGWLELRVAALPELVGEHIEQQLRVRGRVQMPAVLMHDELLELFGIDEVTVMGHCQSATLVSYGKGLGIETHRRQNGMAL